MLLQKLLEVGQAPVVLSALQRGAELGLDSTGRTSWLELFKEFGKNGDMSSAIKWVPCFGTVADNPRVLSRVQHVQQVDSTLVLVSSYPSKNKLSVSWELTVIIGSCILGCS